ncbi:MAG: phosphatase PAP2 family protein [Phycisphaerae bacterium]|nr:phosphatase PAP2 family protein [Phycisphaerae bacterium]
MNAVLHKIGWTVAGHLRRAFMVFLPALILPGCGTLPNDRGWGQDAFSTIDFDRVSRAAHDAFFSINTLAPLAGALAFSVDDFDERVSDWAVKHTPVFGSKDEAGDASNYLTTPLHVEVLITALATPSGDVPDEWMVSKFKGLGVELAAMGAARSTTNWLKGATDRTRPDKSSDVSFPSAHASSAFSFATLANRNIDSIGMPGTLKPAIKAGNLLFASGVAWARVEEQRHYPSDVLAGAALGHFLTAFIHDAFLSLPDDGDVDFTVFGVEGGAGVELSFRF